MIPIQADFLKKGSLARRIIAHLLRRCALTEKNIRIEERSTASTASRAAVSAMNERVTYVAFHDGVPIEFHFR